MSKDFENIMKEIIKQNKEIHNVDNHLSKDVLEIKKSIKNIENKYKSIDIKLTQVIEILNSLTIFIASEDELEDYDDDENSIENEEWSPYETPYDDNYYYDEDEDESGGIGE
jgi:hypothetical protein